MCVHIVGAPGLTQVLLPAEVPHLELNVFAANFFDVAADGGTRDNDLTEGSEDERGRLQFVEDCGLAGVLQSDDDQFKLLIVGE